MTTGSHTVSVSTDPWDRFGWVMGAIWLIFLGFPIYSLATSDRPLWERVLGILGILFFATVYVRGFLRISNVDTWRDVNRTGTAHLVVLALAALSLSLLIGLGSLTFLPYLVALAMFSLPLPWTAGVAGTALLLCVIAPLMNGTFAEDWFFIIIVTLVTISTGLVRILDERGQMERQSAAELALAMERDRVARDVHDVLGHSLTVVTVKAELAQRLIDTDPERAREELSQIESLSRVALAEIRATVSGLRVASLAEEVAAADTALSDAGILADLPGDLSVVDPRHRVLMGWVLREAVTNVVRHSGATQCAVEFGEAHLRVTDDGRGLTSTLR